MLKLEKLNSKELKAINGGVHEYVAKFEITSGSSSQIMRENYTVLQNAKHPDFIALGRALDNEAYNVAYGYNYKLLTLEKKHGTELIPIYAHGDILKI